MCEKQEIRYVHSTTCTTLTTPESLALDAFAPKKWKTTTKLPADGRAIFAQPLAAAAVGSYGNGTSPREAILI
jgi:hypothetical protein